MAMGCGQLVGIAPFQQRLEGKGDKGQQGQNRREGEGRDRGVFVIQHLDRDGHRGGKATDLARHHSHSAIWLLDAGIFFWSRFPMYPKIITTETRQRTVTMSPVISF